MGHVEDKLHAGKNRGMIHVKNKETKRPFYF